MLIPVLVCQNTSSTFTCFAEHARDLSAADGCTENQISDPVLDSASSAWKHRELLFSPCLVSAQRMLNILAPLKTTVVQSTNMFNLQMGEVLQLHCSVDLLQFLASFSCASSPAMQPVSFLFLLL